MCGAFIHGHYWYEEEVLKVFLDFKNNAHSISKEKHPEIPKNARKCGINPVNGEPVTNDSEPLSEEAKIELTNMFNNHFSGRDNMLKWIKDNYGKNNDSQEWETPLIYMLQNGGSDFFSIEYYKGRIEYYKDWIEDYKDWIEDYKGRVEYYKGRIEYYKGWIEDYKGWIEYYKGWIEDYKGWIEDCKGSIEYYKGRI